MILNRFAETYDRELPGFEERLKVLAEEQRLAIKSLTRLPEEAVHAITAAKQEIAHLDKQIREVEAKTVDSGKRFLEAAEEVARTFKEWHFARDAMAYETSNRRKAEAVRKVLAKMMLTFTPTGRSRPTSILTDWEFIPVGMNGGEASQQPRPSPLPLGLQSENYYGLSGCRCP